MLRRLSAITLLAGTLVLAACDKEDVVRHGETEGMYLDVGPLKYQVQISRQLNPYDVEDRAYLTGLRRADRVLGEDDVWFAVFIRVQNETDRTQSPAEDYSIEDTQDNVYRPVPIASINHFAYRAQPMPPKSLIPPVNSLASEGTVQGSLLLFKIPRPSLDNRPLELTIEAPGEKPATVDLDV